MAVSMPLCLEGGPAAGSITFKCRGLAKGCAQGEALVARATLSFWGEVDPMTGRIIATGHPLEGECLRGKVLVIESTRGSSATPLVLGLAVRTGHAPAALVNLNVDGLAVLGCIVHRIPMVVPEKIDLLEVVRTGDHVEVDADRGTLTVTPA